MINNRENVLLFEEKVVYLQTKLLDKGTSRRKMVCIHTSAWLI